MAMGSWLHVAKNQGTVRVNWCAIKSTDNKCEIHIRYKYTCYDVARCPEVDLISGGRG